MENVKGAFGGICNRSACDKTGAVWYNHSTKFYYCEECAELINKHNHSDAIRLFGHELCTLGEHKEKDGQVLGADGVEATLVEAIESKLEYLRVKEIEFADSYAFANTHGRPTKKQMSQVVIPVRTEPKVGRNEPCPCGSGVKYKKCCGK